MAVKENIYRDFGMTNLIGKVREYWSLSEFSSIFHVPIPFLEDRHLYKREGDQDTFKRLLTSEINEKLQLIQKWKEIFNTIEDNIIHIITKDN